MVSTTQVGPEEITFGMKAVGIGFNPSGAVAVNEVKKKYAEIIDLLKELSFGLEGLPTERLIEKAITEAQTAEMRSVKAITWKD